MQALQTQLLRLIYPPQCLSCGGLVESEFGLCAACWRETPFITGLTCNLCGTPLPGEDAGPVHCDECLVVARPWAQGRAALLYRDTARELVLGLKHGDRTDLARPAADWMAKAAAPIVGQGMIVAPVPLHWWRLIRRRYNQAALLSAGVARRLGLDHCPDLLQRPNPTGTQDGRSRDGRFANMSGTIRVHPRRADRLKGRAVLLIDDVMTSGATLAAATEACLSSGASRVSVCALARVAKDA